MLGRAAIAMWWDFAAGMQPEIEDWHSHEHFPERLGIPGFLRGSRWISESGGGHAYAMATVRFSPRRGASVTRWLAEEFLPGIANRKGLTGAHLLQSVVRPAEQTTEQKIRGGDAAADLVLLVNGYDAAAVRAVIENDVSAEALASRGARPGAVAGVYRLSYSATAKDFS